MVLKVTRLSKSYTQGDGTTLEVLNGVDLNLAEKDSIAIMGESGSGKTTFLNCITGLDKFDRGTVVLCGRNIDRLNDRELSFLRNRNLGFVFQFHYLLKDFSVKENVMIPCLISGMSAGRAEERAAYFLDKVKLMDRQNYSPYQLSGGEQQRVAIARALVMEPDLLIMDEPTGNLDEHLTEEIISCVVDICNEKGNSVIVATHNKSVADRMNRIYKLHNGFLEECYENNT